MSLDFSALNQSLLSHGPDLLRLWLPGGVVRGREYVVAGIKGGRGESMSVNLQTGAWADFNGLGAKGGDLVSLYAAINGMTQGQALRELGGDAAGRVPTVAPAVVPNVRHTIGAPPAGEYPDVTGAEQVYEYRDGMGALLYVVARFPGKKIRPFGWDTHQRRWVNQSWPRPRPLFGLELLAEAPDAAVLLCEGEKDTLAARGLLGAGAPYVAMTWPNGASSVGAADWTPLRGRRVLIWPDADEAGEAARKALVAQLDGVASEVKWLDVSDHAAGWGAADWTGDDDWFAWAKPRVRAQTQVEVIQPTSEVAGAVTLVEDFAPLPESVAILCETYGLAVKGRSGLPVTSIENVERALTSIPGYQGLVWWDEFYEALRTKLPRGWIASDGKAPGRLLGGGLDRDWTDADTLGLTKHLQRYLGFQTISTNLTLEALTLAGHADPKCAPRDWMRGLVWDGVARLDTWLCEAAGVEDTLYSRAVGRNFLLSVVARTMRPGCQVDTMLVLEGGQGLGKSSLFNVLAGDWYAEATESITSKDFFQVLRGKLIIEVAELDAFSRGDVTRIKQILSCRSDRYRESYGRLAQDHPRRSVFVGTTNETQYLRDSTGARRFWPLEARRINLGWLEGVRAQLFAEAVHAYDSGSAWHVLPAEAAASEAEARRVHDAIEDRIAEYLEGKAMVSLNEVWGDCLGAAAKDFDRAAQWRLSHALRALRWVNKVEKVNGKAVRVWRPIDAPF